MGLLWRNQYKILILLILITFNALIMCQYRGCCNATGSTHYFLSRLLTIMAGAVVPVLVSNLILPWYEHRPFMQGQRHDAGPAA